MGPIQYMLVQYMEYIYMLVQYVGKHCLTLSEKDLCVQETGSCYVSRREPATHTFMSECESRCVCSVKCVRVCVV